MHRLFPLLFLIFATTVQAGGSSQPDLTAEEVFTPPSTTYVGTSGEYFYLLTNQGNVSFTFPAGQVVFESTFPEGLQIDSGSDGNCSQACAELDCQITDQTVSCSAKSDFFWATGGLLEVGIRVTPVMAGVYPLDGPGRECRVDPDNARDELDETNNDCTTSLDPVVVRDLPNNLTDQWLQVSMWHNIIRLYDRAENKVIQAAVIKGDDGTQYHALNDIVRHPVTGSLYVFPRPYQAVNHSLATLDPETGITNIGETGLSLFDSAFTDDGTLYALGRDGAIYTIDTADATPAKHCTTEFSASNYEHSALAWDSNEGLILVGDRTLVFIDTLSFPVNPEDPCNVTTVDTGVDEIMSADVVDGLLYVTDSQRDFYFIAFDGAFALLSEIPYRSHGMIPYAESLPQPSISCPADYYAAIDSEDGASSHLFAVDMDHGRLVYLRELPIEIRGDIEVDPATGEIITVKRGQGAQALMRYDPCDPTDEGTSIDLDSEPSNYFDSDLGPERILRVFAFNDGDPGLWLIDQMTGDTSLIGERPKLSSAFAVHRNEAILEDWTTGSQHSTGLSFFDLADVGSGPLRTLTLSFPPELDVGMFRDLVALDVPYSGKPFMGILARTDFSATTKTTDAKPNALVSIDRAGVVKPLLYLPATVRNFAMSESQSFDDGFEAEVNGCYPDFGVWFDWRYGPNTVSNTTVHGPDARPLWAYGDDACLERVGALPPIAHADSEEEAIALCQSEGADFVELITEPASQPPFGQFYHCMTDS